MNKKLSVIIISIVLAVPALAGTALDPSSGQLAARSVGLGGATLLFADDANGVLVNPSSLTRLNFPQMLAAGRKILMEETQYTLLEWAIPTDNGTFGFGYTALGTGGSIPTKLDPATGRVIVDPSREAMGYSNSVMAFAYSRPVRSDLSLGGALKVFNQSLSGATTSRGTGYGLDLSATYYHSSWLTLGANLQNLLSTPLQWERGGSDQLGGYYKLGCKINALGATNEALRYSSQPVLVGIDIDIPHNSAGGQKYHVGAEYYPQENLALRSGFDLSQGNLGLAIGAGLTNGGFRFDYAYVINSVIPDDNPHYFSLAYVGERVVTSSLQLRRKLSAVRFLSPKDRLITSAESIAFTAEAKATKVLALRTVWTVTAVSETFEVREVTEEELLSPVYLNNIKVSQVGLITGETPLTLGRNVINVTGFTSPETVPGMLTPEVVACSNEARILRVAPFKDTPLDFWASEPIYLGVTLGLVKGYPKNLFHPEKGITRAELVTLLVRTLPVRDEELMPNASFRDVKPAHWAAKQINYAVEKKLVTGYPDGKFLPNKVLSRAEGITILARYAGLTKEAAAAAAPPFSDLKERFWANKYIAEAKEAGLLKYLAGKKFEAAHPFARAEACEVLVQTPKIKQRINEFWDLGVVSAP